MKRRYRYTKSPIELAWGFKLSAWYLIPCFQDVSLPIFVQRFIGVLSKLSKRNIRDTIMNTKFVNWHSKPTAEHEEYLKQAIPGVDLLIPDWSWIFWNYSLMPDLLLVDNLRLWPSTTLKEVKQTRAPIIVYDIKYNKLSIQMYSAGKMTGISLYIKHKNEMVTPLTALQERSVERG